MLHDAHAVSDGATGHWRGGVTSACQLVGSLVCKTVKRGMENERQSTDSYHVGQMEQPDAPVQPHVISGSKWAASPGELPRSVGADRHDSLHAWMDGFMERLTRPRPVLGFSRYSLEAVGANFDLSAPTHPCHVCAQDSPPCFLL